MSWLHAPVEVAAELAPAVWTIAAAGKTRDGALSFAGARAIAAPSAALGDDIRAFRKSAKLPINTRVMLWPEAGDAGVAPIDSRNAGAIAVPAARVLRERVAPLVRAGGRVTGVWLPHECFAGLAAARDAAAACIVAAHAGMTCIGLVMNGAVRARYLSSAAPRETFDTEAARLLARYQHIASLAPHVRELGGARPEVRVLVAGRLPDLRAAMVPLVEELDHEIDVLDADLPGVPPGALESADANDIAGTQLAWALATMALPGR